MTEADHHFSIMSFNLRFARADDGKNCWENRAHLVSGLMDQYPADFIGVQEANHVQAGFLENHLRHHSHIGWYNRSKDWWQSNMIFYPKSWRCREYHHRFLSGTPDEESVMDGAEWPRQCVIGHFEKEGQHLLVANTHFDFDETVQVKSAELVLEFLSGISSDLPAVITGDFNSDPASPAWDRFLDNGFDEVCNGDYGTTFHRFTGERSGRHIDWILFNRQVRMIGKQVIQYHKDGQYPSDHYPVRAFFSFIMEKG